MLDDWIAVDAYLADHFVGPDRALENALRTSAAAGLPDISISPNQGKFLHLLALMQNAERILEIGTLGGYGTIWLARALAPGGLVVTLEVEPLHAEVAAANFEFARLTESIDLRVGPANETLPQVAAEGLGPFDLIFIDADKENSLPYYQWSLKLSRPGTLIVVDNVVREGAVTDGASDDTRVQGVRRFIDHVGKDDGVTATVIQTVGAKVYDGFALVRTKS